MTTDRNPKLVNLGQPRSLLLMLFQDVPYAKCVCD
jgi:hypothetical protein